MKKNLPPPPPKKVGRPKSKLKDNKNVPSAERGTMPGEMKKTYLVNIDLADKIDEIAHQERTTVKKVVNEALTNHVDKYEAETGPIIVPKRK